MAPILVPLDLSPVTPEVVVQARVLARALGCGLCLLHVSPDDPAFVGWEAGPPSVRDQLARDRRAERTELHEIAEGLRREGFEVETHLVKGDPVEKILERARQCQARLIVVGAHGKGFLARALAGSVSESVARGAPCPVVVVPERATCCQAAA